MSYTHGTVRSTLSRLHSSLAWQPGAMIECFNDRQSNLFVRQMTKVGYEVQVFRTC